MRVAVPDEMTFVFDPFPNLDRYSDYHRARAEGRWAIIQSTESIHTRNSMWQDISDDLNLADTVRYPDADAFTHVEGDAWITALRLALRTMLMSRVAFPTRIMQEHYDIALGAIGDALVKVEAPMRFEYIMSPPTITDHLYRYVQGTSSEDPCQTCLAPRLLHRKGDI